MATKTYTVEEIRTLITSEPEWARQAILTLYAEQTADEQVVGQTSEKNGRGFTGWDAEILSNFAVWLKAGKPFTPKMQALAFKKLKKYAPQLHRLAEEKAQPKPESAEAMIEKLGFSEPKPAAKIEPVLTSAKIETSFYIECKTFQDFDNAWTSLHDMESTVRDMQNEHPDVPSVTEKMTKYFQIQERREELRKREAMAYEMA